MRKWLSTSLCKLCKSRITHKHLRVLIRRRLKVRRSRTDLPVDGLFQGQTVWSSCGSGSELCVINVVRLSVKLQSTKHTCGTTTHTHTHTESLLKCATPRSTSMVDLVQRFIAVTVAAVLCFSCFWCCFLTQDFGSLVGSLRQGPVRRAVVSSQFDVQLTSERLVLPPRDQPAALKQQQTETWRHSTWLLI